MIVGVSRHTQTTGERIEDATIEAVDIADATITEAKFSEHFEHGRIGTVSKSGFYKLFTTAFGAAPHVVVTGINEDLGTFATLGTAPAVGSFKVVLTGDGTLDVMFMAWGQRA